MTWHGDETGSITPATYTGLREAAKFGSYDRLDPILLVRVATAAPSLPATFFLTDSDEQKDTIKARCYLAEALDYFGRFDAAQQLLKSDGAHLWETLNANTKGGKIRQATEGMREKVRLVLNWLHSTYYRAHEYASLIAKLEKLRQFANRLVSDEFQCHRTMAQICFYKGRALRQLGRLSEAEEAFREALTFLQRRTEKLQYQHSILLQRQRRSAPLSSGEYPLPRPSSEIVRIERELISARYKAGVILGVGLGWIAYLRGQDLRAHTLVIAARCLVPAGDTMTSSYLAMLCGAILRSRSAGSDDPALAEAGTLIALAHRQFSDCGHLYYAARATYEQALLAFYFTKHDEALTHLDQFDRIEAQLSPAVPKDIGWPIHAHTLRAACSCKKEDWTAARSALNRAREFADMSGIDSLRTSVLIGEGELAEAQQKWSDALLHFKEALRLCGSESSGPLEIRNEQHEARCLFHICRCLLNMDQKGEAQRFLDRALAVSEHVDLAGVHKLRRAVEAEFRVRFPEFAWTRERLEGHSLDDLKHALTVWAVDTTYHRLLRETGRRPTRAKVARELGVHDETLRSWWKPYQHSRRKELDA